VGGRYSDEWQVSHLINPQAVVPESIMPTYAFLRSTPLEIKTITSHLKANRIVGVPYTDAMIENAEADLKAQVDPDSDEAEGLQERYGEAAFGKDVSVRSFDGESKVVSEMDALIAYLQMLGTLVDLEAYQANPNLR
jgi:cytochrome c oxidase cbb3-type subunit 2